MTYPTQKIISPVQSIFKSSICALSLLASGEALAITVDSNLDTTGGGICTLRDAVTSANTNTATGSCAAGSGNDIIDFDPALSGQTITLTSALPNLTTNITIDGSTLTSHVKISGANLYRVFNITAGTIVLTHLDLINGNDGNNGGGGIKNAGTLTINYSTLANNYSGPGFSGGGGIYSTGILTVNNSTFSGNLAAGSAGGIFNVSSILTVNNSTFSGNSVGAGSSGGGIANMGTLTVSNSTVAGNSAVSSGGGIVIWGGPVTVRNTILANNSGKDCSGIIDTALNNLIQTTATACGLSNGTNGNKIGVAPLLGALANNGGLTQTFALLTGSPAINAGDAGTCIATDQRDTARVGVCDIGAFEAAAPSAPTSAPIDFSFSHKQPEIYSREIKLK